MENLNSINQTQISESPVVVRGLTTFHAPEKKTELGATKPESTSHLAINEQEMDLRFGTDSAILRQSYTWTTEQEAGVELFVLDVPRDILALGGSASQQNLQNMPFTRYIFWEGDVELLFQVAGQPFQQGMLLIYWMPLTAYKPQLMNMPFAANIALSPSDSSFVSIRIPYRFFLSVMNTHAISKGDESLGKLRCVVYSKLRSVDKSQVTINMYSKFPNSKFTLPRPVDFTGYTLSPSYVACDNYAARDNEGFEETINENSLGELSRALTAVSVDDDPESLDSVCDMLKRTQEILKRKKVEKGKLDLPDFKCVDLTNPEYQSEGLLDGLIGSVPQLLTGLLGKNDENSNPLGALSGIKMDNPMVPSVTTPVQGQYSGLSKSNGPEPTTSLQLHPNAQAREHHRLFDAKELEINYMLGRECLLARIPWNTNQQALSELWNIELNTTFGIVPEVSRNALGFDPVVAPCNIGLLNQFTFWRADVVIRIVIPKTQFHRGRLRATVAYGAPTLNTDSQTLEYNHVIDLIGEEQSHEIVIPYNSNRKYLRTFEGNIVHPQQNQSLGRFGLFVANQLVASPTVVNTADILVFISFRNVKVAVPRSCPIYRFGSIYGDMQVHNTHLAGQVPKISTKGQAFQAEGQIDTQEDTAPSGAMLDDGEGHPEATTTATESPMHPTPMCTLEPGAPFEYTVSSVLEVMRRNTRYASIQTADIIYAVFSDVETAFLKSTGPPPYTETGFIVRNGTPFPMSKFMAFYAAFGGGLKYRFFIRGGKQNHASIKYFPITSGVGQKRKYTFVSSVDPDWMAVETASAQTFETYYSYTRNSTCVAQEEFYPLNGQSYIDIHVPFQTQYDYLVPGRTPFPGMLALAIDKEASLSCYQSVADDFMPGILIPPEECFLQPWYAPNPPSGSTPTTSRMPPSYNWSGP